MSLHKEIPPLLWNLYSPLCHWPEDCTSVSVLNQMPLAAGEGWKNREKKKKKTWKKKTGAENKVGRRSSRGALRKQTTWLFCFLVPWEWFWFYSHSSLSLYVRIYACLFFCLFFRCLLLIYFPFSFLFSELQSLPLPHSMFLLVPWRWDEYHNGKSLHWWHTYIHRKLKYGSQS